MTLETLTLGELLKRWDWDGKGEYPPLIGDEMARRLRLVAELHFQREPGSYFCRICFRKWPCETTRALAGGASDR